MKQVKYFQQQFLYYYEILLLFSFSYKNKISVFINQMKIALCFWGLTRSLKYTIHSIKKRILTVLKNNKIENFFFQNYHFNMYKI